MFPPELSFLRGPTSGVAMKASGEEKRLATTPPRHYLEGPEALQQEASRICLEMLIAIIRCLGHPSRNICVGFRNVQSQQC